MTAAAPTVPLDARRRAARMLSIVLAVALLSTGCSSSDGDDKDARKFGAAAVESPKPPPPPTVTMVPAAGATEVEPASSVTVEVAESELTTVAVRSTGGDVVEGALEPGNRRWVSKGKLAFGAAYSVQVTTPKDAGPRAVGDFQTAAAPAGAAAVRTSSPLGDNKTYGVAMPIVLKLSSGLSAAEDRAAFERSLSVKAVPATSGAWGWINNSELHFRPKEYWATGSTVHVSVDASGRKLGTKWGRNDLTLDFKIGVKRELKADSKTKTMTLSENGAVLRTMPISMGRPEFPSSYGTMVVIEKAPKAMFDSSTYGLPVDAKDGYRTEVEYPIRYTWGGQFLHSAPWSVPQQGRQNVSHGCINLAPENAKWVFERVAVGDPVTVSNTETPIKWADGWMEWSMDFASWIKHSATGEQSAA